MEIERLVQIAGNYADDFARMDTQSVDAQGSVRIEYNSPNSYTGLAIHN